LFGKKLFVLYMLLGHDMVWDKYITYGIVGRIIRIAAHIPTIRIDVRALIPPIDNLQQQKKIISIVSNRKDNLLAFAIAELLLA